VPVLSACLIEAFGWRGAMLALGVATFVILAPIASWMRKAAPRDGGDRAPVIDDLAAVPEDARAAPEWRSCLQRPRETRWRRCRRPA